MTTTPEQALDALMRAVGEMIAGRNEEHEAINAARQAQDERVARSWPSDLTSTRKGSSDG